MDNAEIQRIMRDYYEQPYGNLDSILKSRGYNRQCRNTRDYKKLL